MAKRIEYKEGEVIGDLIYVREAEPYVCKHGSYRRAVFLCGCCGEKEFETTISNARTGNTTKCPECSAAGRRLPPGESAFRQLYATYRYSATKRDLEFTISQEYFREKTSQNCVYCNSPPSSEYGLQRAICGTYKYNGLDRVDNSKGYTPENCVTCCGTCNNAKATLTREEFIHWAFTIVSHQLSLSPDTQEVSQWLASWNSMEPSLPSLGTGASS